MSELVTFSAAELDRAAHLRTKTKDLWLEKDAKVIVFWQLKPLVRETQQGGASALAYVPTDHTICETLEKSPIFLGLAEDGAPTFAADVSHLSLSEPDANMGTFMDDTVQKLDQVDGAGFVELRAVMTLLTPLQAEVASTGRAMLAWHDSHRFCAKCGSQSDLALGGWERKCPDCEALHYPRTDPVVIMLVTQGNRVLLGRNVNWPDGMYSLLAGFVEPGEPIEAAVRREVKEESNIDVDNIRYVASQPWAFPASLMIGCTARATSSDIKVDPNELSDAMWVSRERMAQAINGLDPEILPARKGAIAHFLLTKWLADEID